MGTANLTLLCYSTHAAPKRELILKETEEGKPLLLARSAMSNWARQFQLCGCPDNHKVKLGRNRSKTNGVELRKMASGLWVFLTYFPAVDAPASETAAVMDQIGTKLENSKTISGVVAQSVRALPSQHLRNSESGFQNLTSNLSWPGVGRCLLYTSDAADE